ncbi:hypothetical protein EDD29_1746 [Actinocorallia herbida]|uniref:Uncharacterized protein n=1 Tax=Actinocorallia herbida TaxID=58109 RepID=A0A3N1CSC4_9ACTN|nr:hypothetical protein [Actinocorallia herbida]ROO84226.1 hypothetical protein EDD29_1746 [Actinocorallia herbida]
MAESEETTTDEGVEPRPRPVPADTPQPPPRPARWVHLVPRPSPARPHDTEGADG